MLGREGKIYYWQIKCILLGCWMHSCGQSMAQHRRSLRDSTSNCAAEITFLMATTVLIFQLFSIFRRLRKGCSEASAHLLSVVSPYELSGIRACFRGSSTLWTIELLLLIPHNLPPRSYCRLDCIHYIHMEIHIETHMEIHIHIHIHICV